MLLEKNRNSNFSKVSGAGEGRSGSLCTAEKGPFYNQSKEGLRLKGRGTGDSAPMVSTNEKKEAFEERLERI